MHSFRFIKMNLAAAFWVNCKDLIELAGRPAKRALTFWINCKGLIELAGRPAKRALQ